MAKLTEAEMDTLRFALSLAAERYREDEANAHDAAFMGRAPNVGMLRLADQFRRQRRDALALLEKLEGDAPEVTP